MPLSSCRFGKFNLYTVETGRFKLDGGAMFGVVPKTLWSKAIAADDKNRIPMALRCLLVESSATNRLYLIDNGIGTKFGDKYTDIYGINFEHSTLQRSLKEHGFKPEDVTDIIFTHLHFDHCGGTTYRKGERLYHQFENARYFVTEKHWATAINPNDREKASFLSGNIEPIKESDRLHLVENGHVYEEGLGHYVVNGHTAGQQLPVITSGGQTVVFMADLLPTTAHIPVPWIMAYDMQPLETLKEKKDFLIKAVEEKWFLFFEHDTENELVRVEQDGEKFRPATPSVTLNDL